MARGSGFWNVLAKRYARQKIADPAAYERKLECTRRYLSAQAEVLEFGCGTGSTALLHAPHVRSIRAIDYSDRMIAIARAKAADQGIGNVTFEVGELGGPSEPETSACPALRCYEPTLGQLAHDLGQVIARYVELARDLLRRERPHGLASEPHEGAQSVVGEGS